MYSSLIAVSTAVLGACVEPAGDEALLDAAYSDQKVPFGFYWEPLDGASLYYESSISIMPTDERGDEWFQLCTNDPVQALDWSEASNQNSSVQRALVASRETEKVYEFERQGRFLSRVHKCSYVDRSMYDFLDPGPVIARLGGVDPITDDQARTAVEYLWFIRYYNNGSRKVWHEVIEADADSVVVSLDEIEIVYGADPGVCDQISLIEAVHRVGRFDGEISMEERTDRTVEGDCH